MGAPAKDVLPSAVAHGEADERTATVVLPPEPEAQQLQVAVELTQSAVDLAVRAAPSRDDQVVRAGRPAHQLWPTALAPPRQKVGKRRVDRHLPGALLLWLFHHLEPGREAGVDVKAPERLQRVVVVRPGARGGLPEAHAAQKDQPVHHPAVEE
ncbi:MAG TPA: hypothetical protein VIG99_22870 [Myxococcaceae bacterium]